MTKFELIQRVAEKLKLSNGKAELIVDTILKSMTESLKKGERIELRGFGTFEVRNYKPYQGRNPKTGAVVQVNAKRLPFFKVGKELRERVDLGKAAPAPAPTEPAVEPEASEAREAPVIPPSFDPPSDN